MHDGYMSTNYRKGTRLELADAEGSFFDLGTVLGSDADCVVQR